MGLHKPFDRDFFLVNGNIGLAGNGSKNLAKGQFAIVDTNNPLPTGARIVSNFAGASPQTNYQIRVGKAPVANTRTAQNSKPYSSHNWKVSDVREISVSAPKSSEQKFDEWIVGFDGINDATAINFLDKQTTSLDIILSGLPIGYKGAGSVPNDFGQYRFKIHFGKEVGQTNQEVVEKAVEEIKSRKFGDGNMLTDLVDITIVDSSNTALSGLAFNFANLTLVDSGDSNALAMVQAQYSTYKVKVTDRVGQATTYTILKPVSVTLPAYTTTLASTIKGCADCVAGYSAIPSGIVYVVTIEDDGANLTSNIQALATAVASSAVKRGNKDGVGTYAVVSTAVLTQAQITTFLGGAVPNNTANFTLIGDVVAVCSNATVTSTAWTAGTTCTATVQPYTIQLKDSTCGTSRLAELQASYPDLVIEEGRATGLATQTITLSGTGTASVIINGVTYSQALATDASGTATAFVTNNAQAILTATGAVITSLGAVITVTDSSEAFPTITSVAGGMAEAIGVLDYVTTTLAGGCQRVYTTTVTTDVLCANCSPIFQNNFTSVAPQSYDFIEWTKAPKAFSESAKMGIKFKAKPFILDPEEFLKDEVPFYETSVRIKVAGGGLDEVNYTIPSYRFPFAIKQMGWQEDRDHLGGNLRSKELQSMVYFDGEIYEPNNNFRKAVLGQESVLDFRKQYIDYAITIGDNHYSQGFGHKLDTAITYHAFVEVGRQAPIEALLNNLAVKAGLPTVRALAI